MLADNTPMLAEIRHAHASCESDWGVRRKLRRHNDGGRQSMSGRDRGCGGERDYGASVAWRWSSSPSSRRCCLLILAGMLGFGRVLFYWIDANHLANEAARWATVDSNPHAPSRRSRSTSGTPARRSSRRRQRLHRLAERYAEIGDPVRVRVQKPFSFIPIVNMFDITVRATSTQRIERFDNGTSAHELQRRRVRRHPGTVLT